MKDFNSPGGILRITLTILHILEKQCQLEIEFNNIIPALDSYLQKNYISYLMLYLHTDVGLIQKWFIFLHWKTIEIKKRYINKKWFQWYKSLGSLWIRSNHGAWRRKLWRQTKLFDFRLSFQWLIYTSGGWNHHCITYYSISSYQL